MSHTTAITRNWKTLVLAIVALMTMEEATNAQNPSLSENRDMTHTLVLKSGSVYSGYLELEGSKYIIRRSNGSSVRFEQGEVDFVCGSMDEAYEKLLSRISPRDVISHQRLASWCMKYRQLEAGERQYATLVNLVGHTRSLKTMRHQLDLLANPRSQQTPANMVSSSPMVRRLPNTGLPLASHGELQKTVDSYSRNSLREFNRSIHQRIVNGCAAAQCHGNPETPMRLWRVDTTGGIASTGVRRNLHSISQFVNREALSESRLLELASTPHGGAEVPAYDTTSHHYHAIRDWILSLEMQSGVVQANFGREQQASFNQESPARAGDRGQTSPSPLSGVPSPVDLLNPREKFTPRDEFDPEIFNRRFHKLRPADRANSVLPPDKPIELPSPTKDPAKTLRSLPPVGEDD